MNTDSFEISRDTKDIIKDLKNLEDLFDFSNLKENHQLFNNKNKKFIGKFKLETPKFIWIDELNCLGSKMCVFGSGDDSKKEFKINSESQSGNIEIEEYKKCLDGKEDQKEIEYFLVLSRNHEIYLQELKKSTQFPFADESVI